MNAPLPEKMMQKFNQQMDVYLKHEELQAKQRKINEQKLQNIFDRNLQLEAKDRKMKEQILSSRYQNEQLKISQEKLKQLQELEKQKKERKASQSELWQMDQKQHEKEIKQRILEIQTKLKFEEFKKKTDDLMNQLDYNLRRVNVLYIEKQEQKQKYLNDYMSQKQLTLNSSMHINESHNQNVYSNYQMQMKRIQEICEQKLKNYESKINRIYKQKYEKMDQIYQKAQQSQEHLEQIKEKQNQIFQMKIKKIKEKIDYFQEKINIIEKKRLTNLQLTYNKEHEHHQQMNQIRARSENIFRNKSLNMLNKQILKEQTFQLVQSQNQLELESKLSRLNQKWLIQQSQVARADKLKLSYLQQLELKISQRDQRLKDQIQNKLEIQRRRLKVIEDMEKQKRDMFLKLESDKVHPQNTSELKYFHSTPKEQSKLFIT
ncbi:unnamed protein product (macronuclear) [Paramecium tetraurelia]|uniref:DUF4515 domain-containing protein n=1 Tax=Paramecium tetraurelia TaxID=5888 RepID=A0C325_PARTE|nr:uncharacterized protein GSPATT00034670001 [Paramecium tetraurelia]CAK65192.1 unnamed protein product [Paramecium tetraurelia]|eukprot:XP_001432589.1 hypothetical protein (macronuclear) [Paramecium tetraurelia strain d4-2]